VVPVSRLLLILGLFAATACGASAAKPQSTPPANAQTCAPGDQDPYAYRPARLQLIAPCVRVIGTIVSSSIETDGDVHLNVRLDDAYRGLLVAGNDFEDGNLIVEPVCQIPPLATDAIRVCAADGAPLSPPPAVGQHVWLEGRFVVDLQHHAWVELHPLYRWGVAP
jgi:hypothetical protein